MTIHTRTDTSVPPSLRDDPPRHERRVRVRVVVHDGLKTTLPGFEGTLGEGEHEAIVYESDLPAIMAKVEDRTAEWDMAVRRAHRIWRDFLGRKEGFTNLPDDPRDWPAEAHTILKFDPEVADVRPEKIFYDMSYDFPDDETFTIYSRTGRKRTSYRKSGDWAMSPGGTKTRPTKRGRMPLASCEVLPGTLPSPFDEDREARAEAEAQHANSLANALGDKIADALNRVVDDRAAKSDDDAETTPKPRKRRG